MIKGQIHEGNLTIPVELEEMMATVRTLLQSFVTRLTYEKVSPSRTEE